MFNSSDFWIFTSNTNLFSLCFFVNFASAATKFNQTAKICQTCSSICEEFESKKYLQNILLPWFYRHVSDCIVFFGTPCTYFLIVDIVGRPVVIQWFLRRLLLRYRISSKRNLWYANASLFGAGVLQNLYIFQFCQKQVMPLDF